MGFGNILKGMFDSRAMGNEVVSSQATFYAKIANHSPMLEPHLILAELWLARRAGLGGNKNPSEETKTVALSSTLIFACLPFPQNARALGLYFLYQERPDVIQSYPEFSQEYEILISPVVEAQNSNRLESLYARYNPRMAKEN